MKTITFDESMYALVPTEPTPAMLRAGVHVAVGALPIYKAMLAAAPAQPAAQGEFGDAYQGAREDLAIWKRRALEAEEKLRAQCDDQSFMGEPLVQPYEAPREKIEALFKQLGFNGQVSVGEILDAALTALKAQQVGQESEPAPKQHPDDAAVDRFAAAMKAKLARSREKGRHGWQNCTAPHLSAMLYDHLYKADPLDVGNFAMMLHQNGQAIELPFEARGRHTTPQPAPAQDVAGWIPVTERLPEVAQEVIVSTEFEGVCAGILDSYGEWFAPCSEYKLTRVTHWMPLPAAPAHDEQSGEVKP